MYISNACLSLVLKILIIVLIYLSILNKKNINTNLKNDINIKFEIPSSSTRIALKLAGWEKKKGREHLFNKKRWVEWGRS